MPLILAHMRELRPPTSALIELRTLDRHADVGYHQSDPVAVLLLIPAACALFAVPAEPEPKNSVVARNGNRRRVGRCVSEMTWIAVPSTVLWRHDACAAA